MGQILSKPEYMGHTVNFRSHKQSYKDKNAVMNPKEDWLIFENTHEAIVDRETWELAQKLRKTPKRIGTLGEANPLTGLLYCADCGAKMYNQRSRGTEGKPYEARQAIRPAQEKAAEQQLEDALQKKPSFSLLLNAKQETSRLLGEDIEERQVRQLIMHRNQEQHRNSHRKRKRDDPER